MGQMEPARAQFTTVSSLETTNSRLLGRTALLMADMAVM